MVAEEVAGEEEMAEEEDHQEWQGLEETQTTKVMAQS